MAALLLGGVALVVGLWLLRLFASAPAEAVRKALLWGAGGLGAALALLLLVSGRGLQAIWAAGLVAPLLWRWWQGGRVASWFRSAGTGGGSGAASGQRSEVVTAWLTMRLDHGSGEMSGRVRQGRQAGRELAELALPELLEVLAECRQQDQESVTLLEAWLDRTAPDWRSAEAPPPAAAGPMDRAEALAVLGLAEGATEAEIRAAHRRLMQAAHPDHGGSDWLAARVNQARDLLLRA